VLVEALRVPVKTKECTSGCESVNSGFQGANKGLDSEN
jgi:hypothetical protein